MIEHGLNTIVSRRSVSDTIDALVAVVEGEGFTVFARIDYAAMAAKAGQKLRPTELILFGNPGFGAQLMEANQCTGIDLPMRALAWQDEDGENWLTYPDMGWIAERHGLGLDVADTVAAIKSGMAKLVVKATGL